MLKFELILELISSNVLFICVWKLFNLWFVLFLFSVIFESNIVSLLLIIVNNSVWILLIFLFKRKSSLLVWLIILIISFDVTLGICLVILLYNISFE